MTVQSIVTCAKITAEKRGPLEAVWVQGGGIDLQVLCLWTEEIQVLIGFRQTKKVYMCICVTVSFLSV